MNCHIIIMTKTRTGGWFQWTTIFCNKCSTHKDNKAFNKTSFADESTCAMAWLQPRTCFFIERADWPKLHDIFKAGDSNVWQSKFPEGFPVEVSALNLLFINIFHDVVVRIESRCMIKARHRCFNSFEFALEKLYLRLSARAIFPVQNGTN